MMWNPFKKTPKQPYRPKGRIGIIETVAEGYGRMKGITLEVQIRVEEIEQTGDLSRIKVLNISGAPYRFRRELWETVPEYLPTNEILWLDK